MLPNLIWFETRKNLLKLSSLIYFGLFFLFSFYFSLLFGNVFQGIHTNFGLSEQLFLNSPTVINSITTSIGFFGILIAAPIFGRSIYQEFETGFKEIIFSTPISKRSYFFVKFVSSLVVIMTILSSIGFGIWIATWMPFVNRDLVTDNHFLFYIAPYLTTIFPNIFVFGALFIAVAAISHKISPVYLTCIVLFVASLIGQMILTDIDNKVLAILVDPFGSMGFQEILHHWSVVEQNTKIIPLAGYFLYNRLFWVGIGIAVFFLGYSLFDPFKNHKEKKVQPQVSSHINFIEEKTPQNPRSLKTLLQLSLSEFK